MKKLLLSSSFILLFLTYLLLLGNTSGSPVQSTGAPSEATCGRSGCHAVVENQGAAIIDLNFNEGNITYVPEEIYPMTVALSNLQDATKNGFQIVALDSLNNNIGSWELTNETTTQTRTGNSLADRSYVTHTRDGVGQTEWSFNWQAPSAAAGAITFYLSVNDSNNNGGRTGDEIYITNLTITEGASTTSVRELPASSVRLYPNPTKGQFFLDTGTLEVQQIELYNSFGQLLLSQLDPTRLNITAFPTGIYYVAITTPVGQAVKKIVKK